MARTADEYKQLSIREFTKAAKVYESGHAGIYEMCKDDYPQMLAELEREPFADVLDVGCGTGAVIELLHEKYHDAHYVGLDLTPDMIAVAQAKSLNGCEFVVGDAEDLPFPANSFDRRLVFEQLPPLPQPGEILRWRRARAAPRRPPHPTRLHGKRFRRMAYEYVRAAACPPCRPRRVHILKQSEFRAWPKKPAFPCWPWRLKKAGARTW